ncbi:protein kinase putativeMAP kinase kinase-like protein [Leptomonas pyrrhocoris]|uniref:non-specific serine/threonine protein kinase n=1 Tax=Leptomonas pyrrhocoris TaxID=157538 RepID=A0A0N0VI45_LEPPY|nr:protein kinase putativeMAP kinase kinase-like protein [Leptomonas pyrrhocoris]KPA86484.1 protein kinase putativeMAP kinase kinase-like protein [Leptomonas pyrrhocoris]|eukprot:XP_015664923.1 protein kinase putativeMAP kinase kinase-like protein [Leptomonas pyrrhocoris]
MSSGNPLEALLRSMMLQGGDGRGGSGTPTMFTISTDGSQGVNPLSMLSAMGPGMMMGGGAHGGTFAANAAQRSGGTSPTEHDAQLASPGNVYSGGVPPMVWIQREQQRMPMHFSATGSPNLDGTRLREEGNEAFKAGRYNDAVRYYTQAIDVDPDSEFNYSNRSFAYFRLREYERAAADAADAIRLNGRFFKGYYRLGMAQMAMNDFQHAMENLRKAWAVAPEANREAIRVSIAKCESKIARAPATPLLLGSADSCGSPFGSAGSPAPAGVAGTRSQWPAHPTLSDASTSLSTAKVDFHELERDVHDTAARREQAEQYTAMHKAQADIVECGERSSQIKQLMSVATSSELSSLAKEAEERQAALRKAVHQQDSNGYCEAKRNRDSTLNKLWDTADHVETAIEQLKKIAKEEQKFFSKFGPVGRPSPTGTSSAVSPAATPPPPPPPPTPPDVAAPAEANAERGEEGQREAAPKVRKAAEEETAMVPSPVDASVSAAHVAGALSASPLTTEEKVPATATSPSAGAELKNLLRRRDVIQEAVCKAQKCFAATDAAAQVLEQAMRAEAAAMKEVVPLLEEATRLNVELELHARQVAQTSTKELSDGRLQALDQVSTIVSRIKADKIAFGKTLREGDRLLDEEAQLEQQRLLRERQRIQLQAEVEWFKVRDEPANKIQALQFQAKGLQQQIAQVHEKQKAVQRRIMELVEQDHPELAWKSMANGSRILRLVKGSGLWQNLSFSDFQIVSTLSSTVNSKVYHAVRRGEHVAIKEISIDDDDTRRRFQREVNIVAGCNHPNIIRIKGVFFDGPFAYILLPYYHRGSLRTQLGKEEPMSWVTVQDMFRQLASGVAYLHERGIVHADIKPSNIMIADDGRPVISDFGIAKDHGPLGVADITLTTTVTNTNTGAGITGTMQYMAPEQLLRDPVSKKSKSTCLSDMWALGVTMLEVSMQNAFFHDPALGKPTLPLLMPDQQRIEVPAKLVGGDEKLAEAISYTLVANPADRATAYDLLAHPYFSSSLSSVNRNQDSSALAKSDERIDAVRSYIHAMRRVHPQKVLVSVSRNHMVESVRDIFQHIDNDDIISPMMVVFQGETGIDEGALTTEMLNLFYDQLITVKKALVCADEDDGVESTNAGSPGGTGGSPTAAAAAVAASRNESRVTSALFSTVPYLPAPDSDGIGTDLFLLLGKVLLKSIIENRPIPIQLSSAVLKFLCESEPSFADLEEYDPTIASSLKRLRLLSSADLGAVGLDFSHFTASFLQAQTEDRYTTSTTLTPENVGDYIALRVKFDLIEKRRVALESTKKGFFCEPSLEHHLKLLSASDLLLLLCGQLHISAQIIVDALEFQGFDSSSTTPKFLKEVLLDMSQNNLRRFLQLCTATAAVPVNGPMKKIKVLKCADAQRLPVGHGCVNQLDLPDYNDKQTIKDKLEIALAHASDGFHIV